MSNFKWIKCSCDSCEERLQVYVRQQTQIYSKIQQINSDRALAIQLQDEDDGATNAEISDRDKDKSLPTRKRYVLIQLLDAFWSWPSQKPLH